MELNEFSKGSIVGVSQTFFGHPLDTLKTLKQNGLKIHNENIKTLYRGVYYPLILSTTYNSLLFGFYNKCRTNHYTPFQSGCISGFGLSWIITPFEYFKIIEQVSIVNSLNKIHKTANNNKGWLKNSPLRGVHYTAMRETFSCGVYFQVYEKLSEHKIHPFISGGIAGCSSWLCSYPLDTMKTKYQIDPSNTFKLMLKEGGLFKGIWFCLGRAFLVNGIGFCVYEAL